MRADLDLFYSRLEKLRRKTQIVNSLRLDQPRQAHDRIIYRRILRSERILLEYTRERLWALGDADHAD